MPQVTARRRVARGGDRRSGSLVGITGLLVGITSLLVGITSLLVGITGLLVGITGLLVGITGRLVGITGLLMDTKYRLIGFKTKNWGQCELNPPGRCRITYLLLLFICFRFITWPL